MGEWPAFAGGLVLGAAAAAGGFWLWELRRARRMGRFFSHAAHEINTPITAISISTLNFLSGIFGELTPDQEKWMDMMREQIGRLSGMVGELRDLIHILLSRDLQLRTESVAVAELVEPALAAVKRALAQCQVEAIVELPADLPLVRVDRDRTVRTLSSMVNHARKFRADGPLRLDAACRGGRVALRLRYRSQPLAPGEPEHCLDLMHPGDAPAHTLNCVGLGLGVLRAVARHQDGDLDFRLEPGGQAEMCLFLAVSPRETEG